MKSTTQWLKDEGFEGSRVSHLYGEFSEKTNTGQSLEVILERYSNYKTKELQAQILSFRNKFMSDFTLHNLLLKEYDEHFGITSSREGKCMSSVYLHPIPLKEAFAYKEVREAALNPNFYGLSISQIVELYVIDDEQLFMDKLKSFIKEKMDNETNGIL